MSPPVRVLVVDDDLAVASLHHGYVERLTGFTVVAVAHTGAAALAAVAAHRPDLVLLDVYLPDLPGTEVLRRLRAGGGHQPDVIAVTAARELETVQAAIAGGVVSYLVKPFGLATFTERMDAYAAHRAEVVRRAGSVGPGAGLDQRDVDRLLRRTASPVDDLPKGLSARTLELVVGQLRASGGESRDAQGSRGSDLSASELAQRCGLSRVSARRYLEHLERSGLATVRPRYGSAGRPENGYAWRG